ncbi:ABC transporter substrate-binding protein [Aneurinibacillus thermoaerophilus]|uniref:ABC transporter substrate-binding protein n=1 Tax=Aneurinibacillus thermoaerophilus TaxID=143495 RepID=A0A1G7YR30_ANETH|nr:MULTISPECIES: ABC transporter substrate-binding protein [Aneurinibacillus]AMA73757.1 sugar ABC transporter substrate-binding protein [Aneurinibacillus sp. XH2]MED0677113.1 ABC transporter substrate-binding protein [Aneurinibacillus thermoaerophilus]MED0679427.1 ABC transporter substrate-binding protein [Aneurinibacillus thermoaerophilus]MED0756423.1 ABC transporter substrate-binding protein [Aneurinibacillus thermoaerophilus]MED0761178.1 ABC transporter substrate-binding protein [Aneuriniba
MVRKRRWLALLFVTMLVLLSACGGQSVNQQAEETEKKAGTEAGASADKKFKIGVSQYVEHPALDAAREGFIKALKDNGLEEGKNLEIDYQNAQADQTNVNTIAQTFAADKKDLILAIATPNAQAMLQNIKDTPILFTAVSDPLSAKLVDNLEKPGKNITGFSDTPPDVIPNTMKAIKDFFPQAKKVGIIYNSGEANSVANVKVAKEELGKLQLTPVEATATNTSEIKQAAESLVGKVDAIYVPQDNTAVAALKSIVSVANKNDIPLFVGELESVRNGGFAGVGFEYSDIGYETGLMAVKILKEGAKPGDLPVGYPSKLNLVFNKEAAKEQGIDFEKLPKEAMDKWKPEMLEKTEAK